MTAEQIAVLLLDSVLRGLQNALPGKVRDEVATVTGPMVEQIGQLALAVEKSMGAVVGLVTRSEFEAQSTRTLDAFAELSKSEALKMFASLRIESDADGFLCLTNKANDVRVALGFRPFQYLGTWDQQRGYLINDAVTNRGSLWIARGKVQGVSPGTDEGATFWTLAVKCGKDGKAANGSANHG